MRKWTAIVVLCLLTALPVFAADKLEQSGKGMSIWFDGGGPPGGSYVTVLTNGARQAAADLGCDLKIYYSDWQAQKMVENFQKALAAQPDGIVVIGVPGDDAFEPFVKEAIGRGIIVTSVDTELPRLQETFAANGFGYAGANNYLRGQLLAKKAISQFKLKKGDKAWVWGLKSLPTRGLSTVGIIEVLEKAGLSVDDVEISPEVDSDPTLGTSIFTAYMAKNPDTRIVFMDHGALTAQLENFFRAAKIEPDAMLGAGFSLSPATAEAVRNGYVDLIGDDQPFMQGYLGVLQVVMTKKLGFSGFNVITSGGFVTKENIDTLAPLAEKGLR
jgi:simple sugar transport system substrate-binding protein